MERVNSDVGRRREEAGKKKEGKYYSERNMKRRERVLEMSNQSERKRQRALVLENSVMVTWKGI